MSNSLIVSSLTKYNDEINGIKFTQAFLEGNSTQFWGLNEMIHYEKAIHFATPAQQWGSDFCTVATNSNNSITFTENNLIVSPITYSLDICSAQIDSYWMGVLADESSFNDDLTKKNEFTDWCLGTEQKLFNQNLEKAIYQASPLSGTTTTLTKFTGLMSQLYGQSVIKALDITLTSASTSANWNTAVEGMIAAFQKSVPEYFTASQELVLSVSIEGFYKLMSYFITTYNATLGIQNITDTTGKIIPVLEFQHPIYSIIKIKGFEGMAGLYRMFLTPRRNVFLGTFKGSEQNCRVWYSQDTDLIKSVIKMRFGTNFGLYNIVCTNFTPTYSGEVVN